MGPVMIFLIVSATLITYSTYHNSVFSAGASASFVLALILMAGIRDRLEFSDISQSLRVRLSPQGSSLLPLWDSLA
jgi:Na+-transporting NADH:ubiquinone oxidoreductase subunit NqrE